MSNSSIGGKGRNWKWRNVVRRLRRGLNIKHQDHLSKDGRIEHVNGENEPLPTLEEIRSWGESFDKLMKCSVGRKAFREFLKCEYSEENILFWQACEDLKRELNPSLVEEKARLIYEDYISILSPKEVSLDSRVREIINRNMVDPTTHTFDEAQNQIYTLMHRDSYPRFLNSPHYKRLAQLNNNGSGGGGTGSGLSLGSGQTHRKESTS
ncbi:UNVERIFIED_CONTAM: hypothetical protein RMT77_009652 [Armadillidium vulgare]